MRITDEMKEKDLGGHESHGGRGDLEPAASPKLSHATPKCLTCEEPIYAGDRVTVHNGAVSHTACKAAESQLDGPFWAQSFFPWLRVRPRRELLSVRLRELAKYASEGPESLMVNDMIAMMREAADVLNEAGK